VPGAAPAPYDSGVVSDAGQSLLVGRLSPDRELARNAAFSLFVRVYLEQAGLLPRRLLGAGGTPEAPGPARGAPVGPRATAADLPEAIAEVAAANPHVVAHFVPPARRAALATLDPGALEELLGWLRAQRVHEEEPQIAYELGMLALAVELPAILVRGLRQAPVGPESRVAELPDGAGYPTVFLATLHPEWRAATGARLFVSGGDAEQLAGWAMLLLSRTLRPPAGSITRVAPDAPLPLSGERFDLALVYNPVPWLAPPETAREAVDADTFILV
jgi:hypothetical protein